MKFAQILLLTLLSAACCNPAVGKEGKHDRPQHEQKIQLDAETCWAPEVAELDWSEIQPAEIDKSWLHEDYDEQGFVVVRGVSGKTIDKAIEEHILPVVRQKVRLKNPRQLRTAARRIEHELKRRSIVVDRFQQTFYKQVGDERIEAFTREAVLLDLSKDKMSRLIRPVRWEVHQSQKIRQGTLVVFVGVIAFVGFVCWLFSRFFNRLTRGYYVWPVRLVTATVLLGSFCLAAGITFSILRAL